MRPGALAAGTLPHNITFRGSRFYSIRATYRHCLIRLHCQPGNILVRVNTNQDEPPLFSPVSSPSWAHILPSAPYSRTSPVSEMMEPHLAKWNKKVRRFRIVDEMNEGSKGADCDLLQVPSQNLSAGTKGETPSQKPEKGRSQRDSNQIRLHFKNKSKYSVTATSRKNVLLRLSSLILCGNPKAKNLQDFPTGTNECTQFY